MEERNKTKRVKRITVLSTWDKTITLKHTQHVDDHLPELHVLGVHAFIIT